MASCLHTWSAPLDLSYYCSADKRIELNPIGSLLISGIQAQAFHEGPIGENAFDFGPRKSILTLYTLFYESIYPLSLFCN